MRKNGRFVAVLVAASAIDWDTTILPDDLTLPLLWAGLIAANKGRLGKTLWTEAEGGDKVEVEIGGIGTLGVNVVDE